MRIDEGLTRQSAICNSRLRKQKPVSLGEWTPVFALEGVGCMVDCGVFTVLRHVMAVCSL